MVVDLLLVVVFGMGLLWVYGGYIRFIFVVFAKMVVGCFPTNFGLWVRG